VRVCGETNYNVVINKLYYYYYYYYYYYSLAKPRLWCIKLSYTRVIFLNVISRDLKMPEIQTLHVKTIRWEVIVQFFYYSVFFRKSTIFA